MAYVTISPISIPSGVTLADPLGALLQMAYPNAVQHSGGAASGGGAPATGAALQFAFASTPAATPTGTPLFAYGLPTGTDGVTFIVQPGQSVGFVIASAQPTSAPAPGQFVTYAQPSSATEARVVRSQLASNENVYVVAGSCLYIAGAEALIPSNVGGANGGTGGTQAVYETAPIAIAPGTVVGLTPIGVGVPFAVPTTGTTQSPVALYSGAPGGVVPAGATGVQFYLPVNASVSYTIAATAAAAVGSPVIVASNPSNATIVWPENVANGLYLFIVAAPVGSPSGRYL